MFHITLSQAKNPLYAKEGDKRHMTTGSMGSTRCKFRSCSSKKAWCFWRKAKDTAWRRSCLWAHAMHILNHWSLNQWRWILTDRAHTSKNKVGGVWYHHSQQLPWVVSTSYPSDFNFCKFRGIGSTKNWLPLWSLCSPQAHRSAGKERSWDTYKNNWSWTSWGYS